jgi:hypothetical protein
MSDSVVATVAVVVMSAGAAWSEWVSYRRSRALAEAEAQRHPHDHARSEASR